MIDLRTPEDRDLACAEYVLGTLDDGDRVAFEAAAGRDAALQAAVHAWQDRLLPLSSMVPALQPSIALWSRIEASVQAAAAPAAARETPRRSHQPWWQRLGPWRALSGLSLAAVLLWSVLTLMQPQVAPGARYLAVLQAPQGGVAGWVVEVQAGGELRLLPLGDRSTAAVPAGRALQFWTKPEGADGPTSLGLVQDARPLVMPAARLPAVGERQLFEITLEPAGGSPLNRPTGPILFVGRTVPL